MEKKEKEILKINVRHCTLIVFTKFGVSDKYIYTKSIYRILLKFTAGMKMDGEKDKNCDYAKYQVVGMRSKLNINKHTRILSIAHNFHLKLKSQ